MSTKESLDVATRERLRSWLIWLMNDRGDDQPKAAARLGVKQPTISQILSGSRTMGLDVFVRISRYYGVPATQLLTGDPPSAVAPTRSARTQR